jgi:hypothetical protein
VAGKKKVRSVKKPTEPSRRSRSTGGKRRKTRRRSPFRYDHAKCTLLLRDTLISALVEFRDKIRKFHAEHAIIGIAYHVMPWQPFVAISFRVYADDRDKKHDPREGNWTGCYFIGMHNASDLLEPAWRYLHASYEIVKTNPYRCQELNHMAYLAAAEALLDPQVTKRLTACELPASPIRDQIPYREFAWFDRVVVDEDRVFRFNYCDVVCAERVKRRLLRM